MRIALAAAILTALVQSAFAQQPDIPMLQRALAVVQAQRNQALDAQAGAEVRAAMIAEENARLKAQVKALEANLPPTVPDEKK